MKHEWANFRFIVLEIGGSEYHLTGREGARMRVRIRDAFTCQSCGDQRTPRQLKELRKENPKARLFDVHHLNGECGNNSRGYDSVSNLAGLITLCHKCHFSHHQFSKRLGIKNLKVLKARAERDEKIRALSVTKTMSETAREMGMSRQHIEQLGKRIGITFYRKPKKIKPERIPIHGLCECGVNFVTFRKDRKFCSRKCLQKYRNNYSVKSRRIWYSKVRKLPQFKELVRRRNAGEKGLKIRDFVPQ